MVRYKLSLICAALLALLNQGCSSGTQAARVHIPIPSDAQFKAAGLQISKSSMQTSSAASTAEIGQSELIHAVINVSGPGVREQIKGWDKASGEARPTQMTLDQTVPFGKDRMFQAIFVFATENGMQIFYGDTVTGISTPAPIVTIDLSPLLSNSVSSMDVRGRFFMPNGQPAHGEFNIAFQPPAINGLERRPMNIEKTTFVNGWGQTFLLNLINFTFRRTTDGAELFRNVNSSSSLFQTSQRVIQFVKPTALFSIRSNDGSTASEIRDLNEDNGDSEISRIGFFGPASTQSVVCLPPAQPLFMMHGGGPSTSGIYGTNTLGTAIQWNPSVTTVTSHSIGVIGGLADSDSRCVGAPMDVAMKLDIPLFIEDQEWQGFGYSGVFKLSTTSEAGAPTSPDSRKNAFHTEYIDAAEELRLYWVLLPGMASFVSSIDFYVVTNFELLRDSSRNQSGSVCQTLMSLPQAPTAGIGGGGVDTSYRLAGPVSAPPTTQTATMSLAGLNETDLAMSEIIACPRSTDTANGVRYYSDFEHSRWFPGLGMGPNPGNLTIHYPAPSTMVYRDTMIGFECAPSEGLVNVRMFQTSNPVMSTTTTTISCPDTSIRNFSVMVNIPSDPALGMLDAQQVTFEITQGATVQTRLFNYVNANMPMGYMITNSIVLDGSSSLSRNTAFPGGLMGDYFALSFWFKRDPAGYGVNQGIMSAGASLGDSFSIYCESNSNMSLHNLVASSVNLHYNFISACPLDDLWHHVVINYDDLQVSGLRFRLYLDGVQVTSNPIVDAAVVTHWGVSTVHTIGADADGYQNFFGSLADIRYSSNISKLPADFVSNYMPLTLLNPIPSASDSFHLTFMNGGALGENSLGNPDFNFSTITGTVVQSTITPTNPL